MPDEASTILAMVADGKITADEGAQLLRALNQSTRGGRREIHIEKIVGESRHARLHGHAGGCTCIAMSGCEEVDVWREDPHHG